MLFVLAHSPSGTTGLATTACFFVDGRPCAGLSFVLVDPFLFVRILDMLSHSLLLIGVFRLVIFCGHMGRGGKPRQKFPIGYARLSKKFV